MHQLQEPKLIVQIKINENRLNSSRLRLLFILNALFIISTTYLTLEIYKSFDLLIARAKNAEELTYKILLVSADIISLIALVSLVVFTIKAFIDISKTSKEIERATLMIQEVAESILNNCKDEDIEKLEKFIASHEDALDKLKEKQDAAYKKINTIKTLYKDLYNLKLYKTNLEQYMKEKDDFKISIKMASSKIKKGDLLFDWFTVLNSTYAEAANEFENRISASEQNLISYKDQINKFYDKNIKNNTDTANVYERFIEQYKKSLENESKSFILQKEIDEACIVTKKKLSSKVSPDYIKIINKYNRLACLYYELKNIKFNYEKSFDSKKESLSKPHKINKRYSLLEASFNSFDDVRSAIDIDAGAITSKRKNNEQIKNIDEISNKINADMNERLKLIEESVKSLYKSIIENGYYEDKKNKEIVNSILINIAELGIKTQKPTSSKIDGVKNLIEKQNEFEEFICDKRYNDSRSGIIDMEIKLVQQLNLNESVHSERS